jgi:hypothetical protein
MAGKYILINTEDTEYIGTLTTSADSEPGEIYLSISMGPDTGTVHFDNILIEN